MFGGFLHSFFLDFLQFAYNFCTITFAARSVILDLQCFGTTSVQSDTESLNIHFTKGICMNNRKISEHREKIGNTTFVVRSHDNPRATESPQQLILKLLESKIRKNEVQTA
jgi:hypothetical protein